MPLLKVALTFLIFTIISSELQSQIHPVLEKLIEARGLTSNDISIPVNFDEEASARGGFKLMLPFVKTMMLDPFRSFSFPDSLLRYSSFTEKQFIGKMFEFADQTLVEPPSFSKFFTGYEPVAAIRNFLRRRSAGKSVFMNYSKSEREFLKKKIFSMMSDPDEMKTDYSDIFNYNKARDSSIAISKRVVELLNNSDKAILYQEGYENFCFMLEVFEKCKKGYLKTLSDDEYYSDEEGVDGDILYYEDDNGFRMAIGSSGSNSYNGHFDLIIDTGGDDVYSLLPPEEHNRQPVCIIDLGGNDLYTATKDFSLASAFFGSSFIFDASGDDTYKGAGTSCASAICGLAVILDEAGNDIYTGVNHSIGAATFGVATVIDKQGNDIYSANSNSQGFGSTKGVGVISDLKGNDSYLVDSRSLDIGRYEDHYISMCQGYGNGVRPYYAGGIGLIIEPEGNDIYNTDIFGQGGAYWFSLGCIADGKGNDKYNSYQYGQGAGIHLAVGILKDIDGWDFYSSNGVSQGCGHDYGFGLLHDIAGNDNYSAYSLSQGAGNANGIGILLDESGRDGYLNKEPGNTRGYGNSRRDYGSIGLFVDASGTDFYSLPGYDSTYSLGSMWGGFLDEGFLPEQISGSRTQEFKIQVDSSKTYNDEEFLIMAKTIEPRFSLWKEYGFRELVNDSILTSQFVLKYLGTEDHRTALVLRDLAQKIRYAMSTTLESVAESYLDSRSSDITYSVDEISYLCYLLGESGMFSSGDVLLRLTNDNSKRIRASAVNALGKLKIDSAETDFTLAAAERLRDLISRNDSSRIFRKDLAFALRKYKVPENIPVLKELLHDDFFGVRFIAAESLGEFGELYYLPLLSREIENLSQKSPGNIAFIMSLAGAGDERFKEVVMMLESVDLTESCQLALISLIEAKGMNSEAVKNDLYFIDLTDKMKATTNLRTFKNEY